MNSRQESQSHLPVDFYIPNKLPPKQNSFKVEGTKPPTDHPLFKTEIRLSKGDLQLETSPNFVVDDNIRVSPDTPKPGVMSRKTPRPSILNFFQKRFLSQQQDAALDLQLEAKPIFSNVTPKLSEPRAATKRKLSVNVMASPLSPTTENPDTISNFAIESKSFKRKRETAIHRIPKSPAALEGATKNRLNPWEVDATPNAAALTEALRIDPMEKSAADPPGDVSMPPISNSSPYRLSQPRKYQEYNARLAYIARKNSEAKKINAVQSTNTADSPLNYNAAYNRSPLLAGKFSSMQKMTHENHHYSYPSHPEDDPNLYRVDPEVYNRQLNKLQVPSPTAPQTHHRTSPKDQLTPPGAEYLTKHRYSISKSSDEVSPHRSSSSSPKLSPRMPDSIYKRTAQIKRTQQKLQYYITRMLRVKARRTGRSEYEELASCFRIFDSDRNSSISAVDLQRGLKVLGAVIPLKDIEKMMKEYNGDLEEIDFYQFLEMILEADHPILVEKKHELEQQRLHKQMMQKMTRHYEFGETASLPSQSQLQVDQALLVENVDDNDTVTELRSEIQRLLEQNTKLYGLSQSFKMTNDAYKLHLQQMENKLHLSEEQLAQLQRLREQEEHNPAAQRRHSIAKSAAKNKSEFLQQKKDEIMMLAPPEDASLSVESPLRKTEIDFIEEQLRKDRIKYDSQSLEHYTKACRLYTKKKYQLSKQHFQKCLAIVEDLEELNFRKRTVRCLHNMGLIYYFLQDYKVAADYYERALFIAEDLQDDQMRCVTLSNLGIVYYTQESFLEALQYLRQAVHIFERNHQMTDTHATLATYMGWIFEITRSYSKSIKAHTKALKIFTDLKNTPGKAECHFRLGQEYLHEKDFDSAKRHFEQALKLNQKQKKVLRTAMCHKGLGMCLRSLNMYPKALKSLKQALSLCKKAKNVNGECLCYFEIGVLHRIQKAHDMALSYFERCIAASRNMTVDKQTTVGVCCYNMGMIYHSMIQPQTDENYVELAMKKYNEALKYLTADGGRTVANVWHNIGAVQFNEHEYEAAIEAFERALAIYKQIQDQSAYDEVLKKIAITLRHSGRPESALKRFEDGVEMYSQQVSVAGG